MIRINYGINVNTKNLGSTFCNKFRKALDQFVTKHLKKTHVKDFHTVFIIAMPGMDFPLCQIKSEQVLRKAPLSTRRKKQLKARTNRSAPNQLKKATKKVVRKKNSSHSNYLKQKRDKFGRFIPKKVTKKCRCKCRRSR